VFQVEERRAATDASARIERAFFGGKFNTVSAQIMCDEDDACGGTTVYAVPDGLEGRRKVFSINMAMHYAWRGSQLAQLCLDEWACVLEVRPLPSDTSEMKFGEKVFRFHPAHPLYATHAQYLRQKLFCPLYAGSLPGAPSESTGDSGCLDRWAAVFCCTKIPWDYHSAAFSEWGWDTFSAWAKKASAADASFLDRSRLEFCRRLVSHADQGKKDDKSILDGWNMVHQKIWGVPHPLDVRKGKEELEEELSEVQRMRLEREQQIKRDEMDSIVSELIAAKDAKDFAVTSGMEVFENAENLFSANHASMVNGNVIGNESRKERDFQLTARRWGIGLCKEVLDKMESDIMKTSIEFSTSAPPIVKSNQVATEKFSRRIWCDDRLDDTQKAFAKKIVEYVIIRQKTNDCMTAAPLLYLHAGPGCGKSFVARIIKENLEKPEVMRELGLTQSCVTFMAPSGVAAANLPQGSTCHHGVGLAFGAEDGSRHVDTKKSFLDGRRLWAALENVRVLFIDEVSMVNHAMLHQMDMKLREAGFHDDPRRKAIMFGGFCVVLMGDMVQMAPVAGRPLFESVHATQNSKGNYQGYLCFEEFQKATYTLSTQWRAGGDPDHCAVVKDFRTFSRESVARLMKFADDVKHITKEELFSSDWFDAVFVSTDRKTVHAVNEAKMRRFAREKNLPIVTWRLPCSHRYGSVFDRVGEVMYDHVRDLWAYFVCGAPCAITANIRPEKGLANGTPATLHSLVMQNSDEQQTLEAMLNDAEAGHVVELAVPPAYVVVSVSASRKVMAEGLPNDCGEDVLVPLKPQTLQVNIERYLKMKKGIKARSAEVGAHPYKLMFATTYHGVQCQSVRRIVLCVDAAKPALTYNSWYVGISRVTAGDGLRVCSIKNEPEADWRTRLKCLKPSGSLMAHVCGRKDVGQCIQLLKEWYRAVGINYTARGQATPIHGSLQFPIEPRVRRAPSASFAQKAAPNIQVGTKRPPASAPAAKEINVFACGLCGKNCGNAANLATHAKFRHPVAATPVRAVAAPAQKRPPKSEAKVVSRAYVHPQKKRGQDSHDEEPPKKR